MLTWPLVLCVLGVFSLSLSFVLISIKAIERDLKKMKFSSLFIFVLFAVAFVSASCSSQRITAWQPSPVNPEIKPFSTEELVVVPQVVMADYISQPVEFISMAVNISADFTLEEKYLVRAKTDKLFYKRDELFIDFGQIAENSFVFPLPDARVLSLYGKRHGRNHTGYDLKTFANDTIRAAFDGIVRIAGKSRGYGNVVVIRHYNGLETVYGHNSRFLVKAGDRVTAGTPISLEGRTGRATTEHLHFETRINGQPFDPSLIIDFTTQKLYNKSLVFTPDNKGKIRIDQV